MRLAESAEETANLQQEVKLYDAKLTKKSQYVNELKERDRLSKAQIEEMHKANEMQVRSL